MKHGIKLDASTLVTRSALLGHALVPRATLFCTVVARGSTWHAQMVRRLDTRAAASGDRRARRRGIPTPSRVHCAAAVAASGAVAAQVAMPTSISVKKANCSLPLQPRAVRVGWLEGGWLMRKMTSAEGNASTFPPPNKTISLSLSPVSVAVIEPPDTPPNWAFAMTSGDSTPLSCNACTAPK